MSGETRFSLTAQDNVDAFRTHTGRIFGKLSWILLGVAFLFPVIDIWAGIPIVEDTAFFICLGLALFFIACDFLAKDWLVRRAFRQSEAMRSPILFKWDDESVRLETDTSAARYNWSQFWRWMGSSRSLLLYRDSQMFIPIPRRVLPEGAYEELTQLLRVAGVREKGLLSRARLSPGQAARD